MGFILSVLSFFIVLGIVVLIHEFGHYIAARIVGVRVEIFSFGFGKRLFGKQIGETDFRLSLIPLGGYVKLSGEEYEGKDKKELRPYDFYAKNRGQRIFVLFMGPFMNFILAFIIMTFINMSGIQLNKYLLEPVKVGYVFEKSPAKDFGLKSGDLIVKLNGNKVENWKDFEMKINVAGKGKILLGVMRDNKYFEITIDINEASLDNPNPLGILPYVRAYIYKLEKDKPAEKAGMKSGDIIYKINGNDVYYHNVINSLTNSHGNEMTITVKRGDKFYDINLKPFFDNKLKRYRMGVQLSFYSDVVLKKLSFIKAVPYTLKELKKMSFLVLEAFKNMIKGKVSAKNLSGPIEIASISKKALQSGIKDFFFFIAIISLQLGIINLFPVPALDGGSLLIFTVESIIRRDLNEKFKAILINIGIFLLLSLMVFVILNDIVKALPDGWNSLWPF